MYLEIYICIYPYLERRRQQTTHITPQQHAEK